MSLIKCPECGREISDQTDRCPECGYPIQHESMNENPDVEQELGTANDKENGGDSQNESEQKSPDGKKSRRSSKTKKIIGALIGVVIIIGVIVAVAISNRNAKIREQQKAEQDEILTYNGYIDDFNSLYSKVYKGAAEAESVCVLTANVWTNSIYGQSDEETDKYTAGTSDFNAAIQNVYNDEEIGEKLVSVREIQEKGNQYIQNLQSCPDELDKCYDAAVQVNTAYSALADLAMSPSGNLRTYRDTESERVETLLSAFKTLGAIIPPKKEVPLYDEKGNEVKDEFPFVIYLNQAPDKLPDTVDGTMAKIGLGAYKDTAKVCGTKGDINYNAASGVVDYINWSVENPDDAFVDKVLEKLTERYGEGKQTEDNTYSWNNDKTKDSLLLKVENDKVSISWFNIK